MLRAQKENRLGIYGMRERVELLQGRLTIGKSSLGGTELLIVIPQNAHSKGDLA